MRADDARHGSVAGYRAGCRDACCRKAIAVYNQMRKLCESSGRPTSGLIPAVGTQRRLQALSALGWSMTRLSPICETHPTYLRFILRHNKQVAIETAERVALAFDTLSMKLPPMESPQDRQSATRTRRHAVRQGWVPPLAWDDIDLDDAPATSDLYADRKIDPVLVERVMGGDASVCAYANIHERREITARWAGTGRSLNELERMSRWNVGRYKTALPTGEAA